ncbi:unnamed protein product [Dicrocoelium dendriticum]|nr:unnamed protein product [Dicrocoelium dendriticum]
MEFWVQPPLTPQLSRGIHRLVLLSTRPLCAPRMAVAPWTDLPALFYDKEINTPHVFHSSDKAPYPNEGTKDHPLLPFIQTRHSSSTGTFRGSRTGPPPGISSTSDTAVEQGVEVSEEMLANSQPGYNRSPSPHMTNGPIHVSCYSAPPDANRRYPQLQSTSSPHEVSVDTVVCVPTLSESGANEQLSTSELDTSYSLVTAAPNRSACVSEHQASYGDNTTHLPSLSLIHSEVHDGEETHGKELTKSTSEDERVPLEPVHTIEHSDNIAFNSKETSSADSVPASVRSPELNRASPLPASRESQENEQFTGPLTADVWHTFMCPTNSTNTGDLLTTSDYLLGTKDAVFIPFVDIAGRAVIAISRLGKPGLDWIFAPKSFGIVCSMHVSPDAKLVWCLRNSPKDGFAGYTANVCLEPKGVAGLCAAWTSGQSGHWETNVLLRVTSLDLKNTHVIFTTCSGQLKMQFNLSAKRPCCQSYTWPCPNYHLLQAAASDSGLVWALAVTRHSSEKTTEMNWSMEELCLLSASVPDTDGTDCTNRPVKDSLRASRWLPIQMPPLLQSSARHLVHRATSLDNLIQTVNSVFQISFSTQRCPNATPKQKLLSTGWLFVRPPAFESITDSSIVADGTLETAMLLYGCGFFLPNLCPLYKPNDSNWHQIPISGLMDELLLDCEPKNLIKRFSRFSTTPGTTLLRIASSSIREPEFEVPLSPDHEPPDVVRCPKSMWLIVHHPIKCNTLLARAQSALSAFRWLKYRVQVQLIRSGSPLPDDIVQCHHIWRFPLLINTSLAEVSGSHPSQPSSLWTLNTVSNELFCHIGSSYSRSLALPFATTAQTEVTALCSVTDTRPGLYHLVIATRDGQLFSRVGLSNMSPTGTSWSAEAPPAQWADSAELMKGHCNTNSGNVFFTSLVAFAQQLWATDSLGRLYSTSIRLAHKRGSEATMLLHPRWTLHSSTTPDDPHPSVSEIFFLSIGGADWRSHGLGLSRWAVGLPMNEAIKNKASSRLTQSTSGPSLWEPLPGFVYARCWASHSDTHSWLRVAAPLTVSIHVLDDNIWLLSSSNPRQILLRRGLLSNYHLDPSANLPAPSDTQIGTGWLVVPQPDPLSFSFNLDSFSVCTTVDARSQRHTTRAVVITKTGELLSLVLSSSIAFGDDFA